MEHNQTTPNKHSALSGCIAILLIIAGIWVLYNDFIDVPRKNTEYLKSCYYFSFALDNPGAENDFKRDLFYDCLGDQPDRQIITCWGAISDETKEQSFSTVKTCKKNLYDGNKIIFK